MLKVSRKGISFVSWVLLTGQTLLGQVTYTQDAIEDGGKLFRANCVVCHGPNGDLVPSVDLGHGKFRRASADEELIQIIQNGIPGTAMPPSNIRDFEAGTLLAYLRSLAIAGRNPSRNGDAARGKALFEGKGGVRHVIE